MVEGGKKWGKQLHALSKVFCDNCGKECTDEFYQIFKNRIKDTHTTGQQPFEQIKSEKSEICLECAGNPNI